MNRFLLGATVVAALLAGTGSAGAQARVLNESVGTGGIVNQRLELTSAQKSAIYAAVIKDKSKTSPTPFQVSVGAPVPPAIELYALPDEAMENNPAAKLYKYTLVQDQVVVVDPTKMQVVDIIRN